VNGRLSFERGMWLEGLVGGLATIAVAWPITDLLRESSWLDGALLLILVVVVSGGLLRTLDVGPSITVLLQTLIGLVVMWWRFLPETLWYGLPTRDTAEGATLLLQEAGRVLQTYAAPAPTTEGVEFLVVAMVGLTALSVDAIAVTGRAPATAGLPLAAAFMVPVSNTGTTMEPHYFIAAVAVWLLMMAQQGDRIVSSWSSADRREAVGDRDVSRGPTGHRTVARVIGGVTVVGALVIASLLPHLPPYLIGDGLARNPDARGGSGSAGGTVSFTDTMDLTADLNSRSQEPVLRYRTSSTGMEPLRVTAASVYDDGSWQPPQYSRTAAQGAGVYQDDPQSVLAADVPFSEGSITVLENHLEAPSLAVPFPVLRADLGVGWTRDVGTDALRVQDRPEEYEVTFIQVGQRGRLPEGIGGPVENAAFPSRYLEVDEASRPAIEALLEDVVGDETHPLRVASLIQNHLRSGQYVYSLELAPNPEGLDPITHFLQTRQGYCVQYATAMVMAARAKGIPSRMAVGFLAGELQQDGTRVVKAADAHTWPELYISGLGWTRFEPTPGRAVFPPAYAAPDLGPTEAEPTQGAQPEAPTVPVDEAPAAGADQSLLDQVRGLLPAIGRALLVVLVLALLMAIVPWAGRRHREAALRNAQTPEERVEGQWVLLTRSLEDLGIDPPEERSPRQMRQHYAEHAHLDRRTAEALGRVATTLEKTRYAAPDGDEKELHRRESLMSRDVRSVVESVKESLPWNIRANAAVLPRSGMRYLRSTLGGLLRRLLRR
jgi:transglutaminase-like putative cysteine protease